MRRILLSLSILVLFSSCSEKKPMDMKNESVFVGDTIKVPLSQQENNDENWLNIIESTSENTLTFQTRIKDQITSIAGFGNTELVLNEFGKIKVDTIDFGNDGMNEFIYYTYVKGSTYGALVCYLIYSNNGWKILRIPFDRLEIKYNDILDDYVIVSYQGQDSMRYKFESGILIP